MAKNFSYPEVVSVSCEQRISDFFRVWPDPSIQHTTEIWEPKFSRQHPKERNCGQHCVAMITHLPVQLVVSEMKKRGGTNVSDVCGFLRWFGWDSSHFEAKCKELDRLPELCILHVRNYGGGGHWCLYYKGYIWDSCIGVYWASKENMKIAKYRLLGFIEVYKK